VGRVARSESAKAWELRGAWAKQSVVVLSLSERCKPRRLKGKVERVAPTDAFVVCAGWHVPMADVLAVHRPHFEQVANDERAA
jgi:hypothetical protein